MVNINVNLVNDGWVTHIALMSNKRPKTIKESFNFGAFNIGLAQPYSKNK